MKDRKTDETRVEEARRKRRKREEKTNNRGRKNNSKNSRRKREQGRGFDRAKGDRRDGATKIL